MKDTKVSTRHGIVPTIIGLVITIVFMAGCDVFESDPDVVEPEVNVDDADLFVMANGSTIFYLSDKVKTNQSVRVDVTGAPKLGTLKSLGGGLVQYSPKITTLKARDVFEVTIYTLNDQLIKKDSVYISIGDDSTHMQCRYPIPDYVFVPTIDSTYTIDASANDVLCNKLAIGITLVEEGSGSYPHYGSANVVNNRIIYTPNSTFAGNDTLLYKIFGVNDEKNGSIGIVYVSSASPCQMLLDDIFDLDSLQSSESYLLPVFQNDSLCDVIDKYQISIKTNPTFGSASISTQGVNYRMPASSQQTQDSFSYQVCKGSTCSTAVVTLILHNNDNPSSCKFQAVQDTVDVSGNTIPLMNFDVLQNDQLCDSLKAFTITQSPKHGTALIDPITRAIAYTRSTYQNDSLEYQICSSVSCSKAKVYIKQQ